MARLTKDGVTYDITDAVQHDAFIASGWTKAKAPKPKPAPRKPKAAAKQQQK